MDPDNVRCVLNVLCGAYDLGLRICCLNAESIRAKYTVLYQMLGTSMLDVVMVSESWLNPCILDAFVSLPGFNIFRSDRKDRVGGGACMYIRENLLVNTVFKSVESNIDFICVELRNSVEKLLLVAIYCPPNMFKEENLSELEETLLRLSPKYNNILIGGDFNVNFLINNSSSRLLNHFCDKMGFSVVNNRWPTCFKSNVNPSLLDMFLTSCTLRILGYDQIRSTSEFIHDFIFCSFQFDLDRTTPITFSYRSYSNFSYDNVMSNFNSSEWNEIFFTPDINRKVSLLNNLVLGLYDFYVPLVTKEQRLNRCPWFTSNIKFLIRERERFFRRFKSNPTEFNKRQYIYARNKVNSTIRNSKRSYLLQKLDPSLSSRELWSNLKKIGVTEDRSKSKCPFRPEVMVDALIPSYSSSETPQSLFDMPDRENSFGFVCIGVSEILSSIKSVKSNAIGPDDISPKFLRLIFPLIMKYVLHIYNFCLYSGEFPVEWKNSNTIPVPKKANPSTPAEFRPISILSFPGKLLEKVMYNQMQSYLNEHRLLSEWQSGFRNLHSCESAAIKVTTDLRFALDSDKFAVTVLLDFSKAFDSIDHSILISKLKSKFNFSNSSLKLLRNYLLNRVQRIKTEAGTSNSFTTNVGIPQGSVLGPLLFSLFINDLPDCIYNSQIHLYADDVILYIFRPIGLIEDCIVRLNYDLNRILIWSNDNHMTLNPSKSVAMLCARDEINPVDFPSVILNNEIITYVKDVTYLGYKISSNMSCCKAISDTIRKIYYGLRSLRSSSYFLQPSIKKHLIKSLIMPYFTYNLSVYPALDCVCRSKLNVALNDCVRFVYSIPRYTSVSHLRHNIFGINFDDYLKFRLLLRLHDIIHGRGPGYLSEYLHFAHSQRGLKLILPRFSRSTAERSFYVAAIRLWNSLPNELQSTIAPAAFKRKLFLHFSN